jgi:hypothetical protein
VSFLNVRVPIPYPYKIMKLWFSQQIWAINKFIELKTRVKFVVIYAIILQIKYERLKIIRKGTIKQIWKYIKHIDGIAQEYEMIQQSSSYNIFWTTVKYSETHFNSKCRGTPVEKRRLILSNGLHYWVLTITVRC